MVDALDPPPAAAPAAQPAKASKSSAEKKPAKFSHWYVGGGGSAPTGDMSSGTDIGYSGMLAYAAGVGKMTQLRLGGAGNYWSASASDANAYDLTGTFDVLFGKRIPGFVAPYGLLGGVGGVRNTSPPPGFVGIRAEPALWCPHRWRTQLASHLRRGELPEGLGGRNHVGLRAVRLRVPLLEACGEV